VLGEGWDNSVWAVEERWAFRIPRREIAIPGVRRELEVLPQLAPHLPVPIPEPRFVGVPSDRFPWPFFGTPLLPGRETAYADMADADRVALGDALGRFLRVLHAPEVLAAVDPGGALPVDFNRRADTPFRVARVRARLEELPADVWRPPAGVADLLVLADGLPPTDAVALVHGDLHFRHVLIDAGSLAGVIDWGDVCRGDPSIDLMLVWMLLPPAGRERFFASYGPVDEATSVRARVLALFLGLILALYARDVGDARLERESVAALERTLLD
jgi:aminoglycoside phosphotransferase (APT) family kinase protein